MTTLKSWLYRLVPALFLCFATVAAGQNCVLGGFVPMDINFVGLASSTGLRTSVSGGHVTGLFIDVGGGTGEVLFDLPLAAQDALQYNLSPSRQYVLVKAPPSTPPCPGAGQPNPPITIMILRRPETGSLLSIIHTDCLEGGLLNGNGRWYERGLCILDQNNVNTPGAPFCLADPNFSLGTTQCNSLFMARTADASGNAVLCWYNLLDATPSTIDGRARTTLRRDTNDPDYTIDRGGNLFFARHNIDPFLPSRPIDVAIIDVCPNSASFGQNLTDGDPSFRNLPAGQTQPQAAISACTGNQMTVQVQRPNGVGGNVFIGQLTVNRCCSGAQPVRGRCCAPDGSSCSFVTLAECASGPSFWTANTMCSSACPAPAPRFTLDTVGPSTVTTGDPTTYTFTVQNTGFATANNVVVRFTKPSSSFATFVSASDGGIDQGSEVVWPIGSLAVGASRSVSATVRPLCLATVQQFTIAARVNASNAPAFVAASPVILVTTLRPPSDPVAVSVTSVAGVTPPLHEGDTVTHTFTIVNPLNVDRPEVTVSFILGQGMVVDKVIDAAGGTLNLGFFSSWVGTLPATSVTTISFRMRIPDCASPFPSIVGFAASDIQVYTSCGDVIGQAPPPPGFPASSSIGVGFSAVPATGFVGVATGTPNPSRVLIRDGSAATFTIGVRNLRDIAVPAGAAISFPAEIIVNDPPFVGTPPAGFFWDSSTRTIGFAGTLQPGAQTSAEFSASIDPSVRCRVDMSVTGGRGECTNVSSLLHIDRIRPVPTEAHLVGMSYIDGLWTFRPGIDTVPVPLWCFNFSGSGSGDFARSEAGVIFMAQPFVRFDPHTLELHYYDAVTAGHVSKLTYDETTGTLYLVRNQGVQRFDPASEAFTPVMSPGGGVFFFNNLTALPDGRVAVIGDGQLRVLDPRPPATLPLAPGSFVTVPMPGATLTTGQVCTPDAQGASSLAADPDGDLITTSRQTAPSQESITALVRISHQNLATSVIIPALIGPPELGGLGTSIPTGSSAPGENDQFYFSAGIGAPLTQVSAAAPPSATVLYSGFPDGLDLAYALAAPAICRADFNGDGFRNPDDLADFITCFFLDVQFPGFCPEADFNMDTFRDPDDLADFITVFFLGC